VSNLLLRILVAAIGGPLLIYLTSHGSWPLLVLVAILQAGILWEWQRLCSGRGIAVFVPGVAIATGLLDWAIYKAEWTSGSALILLGAGIVFASEVFRRDRKPLANLGGSALFLLYAALPLAVWTRFADVSTARYYDPAGPLAALLLTTWMCDTGAYFIGRALGRHKLYPAASPNKTIEGAIGGVIFAAAVLPVMALFGWARPRPLDYVVLPLIVAFVGQAGDLLESLMKREAQVKDTSAILPGHGGFLDRFDSLLLSTPFFLAYLLLTIA
jgi:phosphatidate cytidylyltransferase